MPPCFILLTAFYFLTWEICDVIEISDLRIVITPDGNIGSVSITSQIGILPIIIRRLVGS